MEELILHIAQLFPEKAIRVHIINSQKHPFLVSLERSCSKLKKFKEGIPSTKLRAAKV